MYIGCFIAFLRDRKATDGPAALVRQLIACGCGLPVRTGRTVWPSVELSKEGGTIL